MKITPISDVLGQVDLALPKLNALLPTVDNYKTILLQPKGEIEASKGGVRNRDRMLAANPYRSFLEIARQTEADLVITPEYSMPWEVLIGTLKEGRSPTVGKLWALGCESITYTDLQKLRQELTESAEVLFEPQQAQEDRFVDPLAYIFLAPHAKDSSKYRLVILVQFKTHPMVDKEHFEVSRLQRGTCIYEFCGFQNGIPLPRIAVLIHGITVQPQSQREFCNTIPPTTEVTAHVGNRRSVPIAKFKRSSKVHYTLLTDAGSPLTRTRPQPRPSRHPRPLLAPAD